METLRKAPLSASSKLGLIEGFQIHHQYDRRDATPVIRRTA